MEGRSSDKRNMKQMENTGMQNMQMDMNIPMTHAFSLNLPMTINGSGTAWLPDASPMYGVMLHSKKWMYMLHGNIDIRYTKQTFTNKEIGKASRRERWCHNVELWVAAETF